jgi:hypothetical protein
MGKTRERKNSGHETYLKTLFGRNRSECQVNIRMYLTKIDCENGTGSGSCPMMDLGIRGAHPSGVLPQS